MIKSHLNYGTNFPPHWEKGIKINVNAEVKPSENPQLVLNSINTLFPLLNCNLNELKTWVIGESETPEILNNLCKRIFDLQILDAARKHILNNLQEEITSDFPLLIEFHLQKQAALVNKISFVDPVDAPLGSISVTISSQHLQELLDAYFPKFEWFVERLHNKKVITTDI